MKQIVFFAFTFILVFSCGSSMSKAELISENNRLKVRLSQLKTQDSLYPGAAVEVKKMNVVYRGVRNPIYISKTNLESFEASAPGLTKIDDLGNYSLNAGKGNTVDIEIKSKLNNGDSLSEIKTLRIKDIGKLTGTINDLGCGNKCEVLLTKDELTNGKVGVKVNEFMFDWKLKVFINCPIIAVKASFITHFLPYKFP